MNRLRMATIWLGGCSGCHMSFLDLDEWLIELAERVDVVYGPLVDVKHYPHDVDLVLIEGAVANEDHLELIREARARTRLLVAFGDCAVTGNVTALRNPLGGPEEVLGPVYAASGDLQAQLPGEPGIVPALLPQVLPVYAVVPVDVYLPGCPPPAPRIRALLEQLLAGQPVELAGRALLKFG
jgi:NAD-reducing hydrogenase small subunit